jgi:uncharacterized membrane protein
MIPGLLALAAALGFGIWALPSLPDQVASHWGLSGEPDGWSSKGTLVYLLPLFGVGIALLLGVVPRIDPRKASFELHGSTYWTLANASIVVLAGVHVALIAYNLGWPVRINQIVGIAVGGLFVLIGNLMTRMRPNWFMGIRTPWTLSSDTVWRKTHRVGGYAFVAAGLLLVAMGFVQPPWFAGTLIVAAIVAALVPVIYSYFVWRGEQEGGGGGGKGLGIRG